MNNTTKIRNTPLRSDSKLTLMTTHAQRLVYGRHLKSGDKQKAQPPIVGLLTFASLLKMIWLGCRQDDPYADLWLIKVHQALQNGAQELAQMHSVMEDLFSKIPDGVRVQIAQTTSPMEIPLHFSTPYAFSGAYLLCSYDKYMRRVLTARHVGILSWSGANAEQNRAGKLVRRTFLSATGYRFTAVNRIDIKENNTRAIFAARQMGMVPKSILDKTERAPHAPTPEPTKARQAETAKQKEDAKVPPDTAQSG